MLTETKHINLNLTSGKTKDWDTPLVIASSITDDDRQEYELDDAPDVIVEIKPYVGSNDIIQISGDAGDLATLATMILEAVEAAQ